MKETRFRYSFLDVIYEQSNDMDPKIHEWRHSQDQMVAMTD